jgi:hypothetical protein
MKEFLEQNWQAVVTLIGGAIVFIYKRPLAEWTLKQQKAETNISTIESLERGLQMYVAMLNDIEIRHEAALLKRDIEIADLQKQITELKELLNKHLGNES